MDPAKDIKQVNSPMPCKQCSIFLWLALLDPAPARAGNVAKKPLCYLSHAAASKLHVLTPQCN